MQIAAHNVQPGQTFTISQGVTYTAAGPVKFQIKPGTPDMEVMIPTTMAHPLNPRSGYTLIIGSAELVKIED